jgi:hypothetical protein
MSEDGNSLTNPLKMLTGQTYGQYRVIAQHNSISKMAITGYLLQTLYKYVQIFLLPYGKICVEQHIKYQFCFCHRLKHE